MEQGGQKWPLMASWSDSAKRAWEDFKQAYLLPVPGFYGFACHWVFETNLTLVWVQLWLDKSNLGLSSALCRLGTCREFVSEVKVVRLFGWSKFRGIGAGVWVLFCRGT